MLRLDFGGMPPQTQSLCLCSGSNESYSAFLKPERGVWFSSASQLSALKLPVVGILAFPQGIVVHYTWDRDPLSISRVLWGNACFVCSCVCVAQAHRTHCYISLWLLSFLPVWTVVPGAVPLSDQFTAICSCLDPDTLTCQGKLLTWPCKGKPAS